MHVGPILQKTHVPALRTRHDTSQRRDTGAFRGCGGPRPVRATAKRHCGNTTEPHAHPRAPRHGRWMNPGLTVATAFGIHHPGHTTALTLAIACCVHNHRGGGGWGGLYTVCSISKECVCACVFGNGGARRRCANGSELCTATCMLHGGGWGGGVRNHEASTTMRRAMHSATVCARAEGGRESGRAATAHVILSASLPVYAPTPPTT